MDAVLQRWRDEGWHVHSTAETTNGSGAAQLERDDDNVMIAFMRQSLNLDKLRAAFLAQPMPILFLVHEDLISEGQIEADEYLLALHALYYGRVYTYRDNGDLWAVHFENLGGCTRFADWQRVQVKNWDFLDIERESWLKIFPGTFRIARLYDKAWWMPEPQAQSAFGRAQHTPRADFWAVLGITPPATRTIIKTAYRNLARIWHPDINASPDATHRMQEINAAYEKAMEYAR